ncbi:MAG: hypothetical protein ACOX4R_02640 [Lentihominibacter sp.]
MTEDYKARLERIKTRERELMEKEKALLAKERTLRDSEKLIAKPKEKAKKQMILRLSPELWNEIAAWAEDDFRSINGQVEYLLNQCVKKMR